MKKILLVEDDMSLSTGLCFEFDRAGYLCIPAYNCEKARQLLKIDNFELAVLDINLPDGNGLELYRELKKEQSDLLIIFLTANDLEQDILKGLEIGAEDYITKPFSTKVLLKKIEIILKRDEQLKNNQKEGERYSDGFLTIDLTALTAVCGDEKLFITATEYKILRLLIANSKRVITRRRLLEIWDEDGNYIDDHTLTVTMTRLRSKIEKEGHKYIKTIRGMGYLWLGE